MIVVDASVAVDYLIKAAELPHLQEIINRQESLAAPNLLKYELGAVLRKHFLLGALTDIRAEQAFKDFELLRIDFYDMDPLVSRAWQLRQNITYYDASYVTLAEFLNVPLLTRDKKLGAAPGHKAEIIVI